MEEAGAFDFGDHRLGFRLGDQAAGQGNIVVDLDHHAAAAEQRASSDRVVRPWCFPAFALHQAIKRLRVGAFAAFDLRLD